MQYENKIIKFAEHDKIITMEFLKTDIEGVWHIIPRRYGDSRGYFSEVFRKDLFDKAIGKVDFIQSNESSSTFGVLRGLHLQQGQFSQAKLVRVSQGCVLDVAVDLRPGSPTRGKYVAVELSADKGNQVFIPKGFAHGFVVLSPVAQFQYMVDELYHPECEMSIRFDDPDLNIDWRVDPTQLSLSDKDKKGLWFKDIPVNLF